MIKILSLVILTTFCLIFFSSICPAKADEGMWTYDNLPLATLKKKYDFTPTEEFKKNLQLSSIRFSDGGSGSFISPTGLILTNHHVAVDQLHRMSTEQKDYVKDGFQAKTQAEEVKCADAELDVLVDYKNVTDLIMKATKGLKEEEAGRARKKEIARIEKENQEKTGLKSQVVSLYHGGEYWLYSYKKYRDIRLVFAPPKQIAYFGGDYDNFTYPRYDFDFAIFRAYENGKPAVINNYLKVNPNGIKEGELVFVSGHPGSTERAITAAQFRFNRDFFYPEELKRVKQRIKLLEKFSSRGPEAKRRATAMMYAYQNQLKAMTGEYAGLMDKKLYQKFEEREKKLRNLVSKNPALVREIGDPWAMAEKAIEKWKKFGFSRFTYRSVDGELASNAMMIVFYSMEIKKPDGERLDGYHDAQLDAWKYRMFSPAPIYKDLEEAILADSMRKSLEKLGANDPYVKILLDGKKPEERAKELIQGTKLDNRDYRKALVEGGEAAVKKSEDPLIKLALKLEPLRREVKKMRETEYESPMTAASEKIAKARFKVYGKNVYPDATFTLRLAFGTIKGYPYNGTIAPCKTTLYGLFDRYYSFDGYQGLWTLPQVFVDKKNDLKLETPLNFVCDADVIGGNSGSPVVNRKGELIGLIFDGNMESLQGNFIFNEEVNRAVAVNIGAIMEILDKIYNAKSLLSEIYER